MIIDWEVYPWHGAQTFSLGCILNWGSEIARALNRHPGTIYPAERRFTLGTSQGGYSIGESEDNYGLGTSQHTYDLGD